MNDNALKKGFPPLQPEDYLAMLRHICIAMWAGLGLAILVQLLIRLSPDFHWPTLGNFSWTYNMVLLEFAIVTGILTYLLMQRDWLERAPRDAIDNLRHLLLVILALDALHLLAAFQLTGSLHGPMMIVVPLIIVTLYLMLPRADANIISGFFVCALLILLAAQAYGVIEARGMLADAFDVTLGHHLPTATIIAGSIGAAVLVGQAAREKMDSVGISLERTAMIDPATRLFTRQMLERRIPGELRRVDRRESTASLMLIEINDFQEVTTRWGYQAGTDVIQQIAAGLRSVTRTGGDTCALYGPTTFAALLPTASQEDAEHVAERIIEYADSVSSGECSGVHVSIGIACAADAKNIERREFFAAATEALRTACETDGHKVVTHTL